LLPGTFLGRWRQMFRSAYHALYRRFVPIHWWLADLFGEQTTPPGLSLPAAKLRFRVGESVDAVEFFRVGKQTADNIEKVLLDSGCAVNDFRNVLDFGCGCGRTLMWLRQRHPQVKWHGSDVDAESIKWCRTNIPSASFTANAPMPPLAYEEGTLDLLYAISVFTHLNEEYQRAWVSEFHRVLRPGGLLLLTVHSEQAWKALDSSEEIQRRGLVVHKSTKLKGIMPDWYQTTFQTPDHLVKSLSANFTIVQYARSGFGSQDAIVARRN